MQIPVELVITSSGGGVFDLPRVRGFDPGKKSYLFSHLTFRYLSPFMKMSFMLEQFFHHINDMN